MYPCDYINEILLEKDLEKSDIIRDAQIPRTYVRYFQGSKKAGWDKILQLAIAMKLNLEGNQPSVDRGTS